MANKQDKALLNGVLDTLSTIDLRVQETQAAIRKSFLARVDENDLVSPVEARPVGYTITTINDGKRQPVGSHRVWWANQQHNIADYVGSSDPVWASGEVAAHLFAKFLNDRWPEQDAKVVKLMAVTGG